MSWRDILRPIRDGFRDNLPEGKPKEDVERERKRQLDVFKGFAYFHTFDELAKWTAEDVLPIQQANTPLLVRPRMVEEAGGIDTSRLTLIHDFAGNYQDYEKAQGATVPEEVYTLDYFHCVDTFVYFSHKLICIPPPTWTNSLHRNGVKSFGTLLAEPGTPGIEKILQRVIVDPKYPTRLEYPLATKMIEMAAVYGFDGWLINLEKTFPALTWSRQRLIAFLEQLQAGLGNGNVIWYDALDVHNKINYQNSLTEENLAFAKAAGSILTNYAWTPEKARAARKLAIETGLDPRNIIFGIDVWAQNQQKHGPKRVTWPVNGGGGTSTGVGVEELSHFNLSSGIFAPGWAAEHFKQDWRAVDRSMWTGTDLPEVLKCDCDDPSIHAPLCENCGCDNVLEHAPHCYRLHCIWNNAPLWVVGTEDFFYTDFRQALARKDSEWQVDVGTQMSVPDVESHGQGPDIALCLDIDADGLHVTANPWKPATRSASYHRQHIFDLAISDVSTMQCDIKYSKNRDPEGQQLLIQFSTDDGLLVHKLDAAAVRGAQSTFTFDTNVKRNARLRSIYIAMTGRLLPHGTRQELITLHQICIKRKGATAGHATIEKIRVEQTEICSPVHHMLNWSWKWSREPRKENLKAGLPMSTSTGPFAYFEVATEKGKMGRAYCSQFRLDESFLGWMKQHLESLVTVEGYGFDGVALSRVRIRVQDLLEPEEKDDLQDWEMVARLPVA